MLGTIRYEKSLVAILLLGIAFSLYYAINQVLVVDSLQLLERGHLFSIGEILPFGPRSSQTNFIMGPFISLFTGILLSLSDTPYSVWFGILLTHIGAFFLVTRLSFFRGNRSWLLLYLVFFWCSPWRASEVFIWNPAFLMPLAVLWLYGMDRNAGGQRFQGTLLMGIAVLLTFQIHNSVLFLVLMTLFMRWKKVIRFDTRAMGALVVIGAVMLAPTAWVLYTHPEVLQKNRGDVQLFDNFFQVGEALKGLTYWLRYPSMYFGSTTFQLPGIDWGHDSILRKFWWLTKWAVGGVSILFVVWANYRFMKEEKDLMLRRLVMFAFVSLLIVSSMSPVAFNFWHLYLVYPFALIPLTRDISRRKCSRFVALGLIAYFGVYTAVSATSSYKHDWKTTQQKDYNRKIVNRSKQISQKYQGMTMRL